MNRYSKAALLFSVFFPLFFLLITVDMLFFNKTVYALIIKNLFFESALVFLFILSYIVAPVYLLIGFYNSFSEKLKIKDIIPFILNFLFYLCGVMLLLMGLKAFLLRPFIIILIHPAFYIISVNIIIALKKKRKINRI